MADHHEVDFADPEFEVRANALIAQEQASFDTWLATDSFNTLIDEAIAAGCAAFQNGILKPDADKYFDTFASIELDHRRAKPLVLALQSRGLGEVFLQGYSYDVDDADFLPKHHAPHCAARFAAVEAFALALSKPGFELMVWTQ